MRLLLDKMGIKFTYPKPVNLVSYLIEAFTNEDDIILDSFAGSGTTGHAVMHLNKKNGSNRKFILIELREDTVENVILPRLTAVISGDKKAGIYPHGGGFRYYKLAPSLLEQDRWSRWVVNKQYNPEMLTQAICKLEGFAYAPSDTVFWQQGSSTETDFIYVTTQTLSVEQLQVLSDEVGEDRSLLVCCSAFRCKADRFANLTLKKIPKMVLSRCEWGHDDYSLNVENLPQLEIKEEPEQGNLFGVDNG